MNRGGAVGRVDPERIVVADPFREAKDGHASAAAEAGHEIWLGSARADRLAIYPLPPTR